MSSFILGKLPIDDDRLTRDLTTVRSFPHIREAYDEFSTGFWQNDSLWNASGDAADTMYRNFDGPAKTTQLGRQLPYLDELVRQHFRSDYIKMVRTRNLVDAMVIPHKDFVEIEACARRCLRVFVALEQVDQAFHSDESGVFNFRKGEIWNLDASIVHVAANFSSQSRIHLCLDFIFPGPFELRDIFNDPRVYDRSLTPAVVRRQPRTEQLEKSVRALSRVMDRHTFRDIVFLLSKLHFRIDVPPRCTGAQYSGHDIYRCWAFFHQASTERRSMTARPLIFFRQNLALVQRCRKAATI
jgi:hypothetical protein